MRTLTAREQALSARANVSAVPLVVLTVYTDHDLGTVDTTWYLSDRTVYYPWETGPIREFLPVVTQLGEIGFEGDLFAPPEGGLDQLISFQLQLNSMDLPPDGTLWAQLRDLNLDYAQLEYAEVLLDEDEETPDLTGFTGDEHRVYYRGGIVDVRREGDVIVVDAETDPPVIEFLVGDALTVDPLDRGRRAPLVVGDCPVVPAIGWEVGFVTTLAEGIDESQVGTVEVSDTAGFPDSPTQFEARIGGEQITAEKLSTTQLTIHARGTASTVVTTHAAGSAIVELIAEARYVVAGHEVKEIKAVYVRSPFTGELVRVTTTFTRTEADTTLIPGRTVASLRFTQLELQTMLDELFLSPTSDGGIIGGTGTRQQSISATLSTAVAARDGAHDALSDYYLNGSTVTFSFYDPVNPAGIGMIVDVWATQDAAVPADITVSVSGVGSSTIVGATIPAQNATPAKYSFQFEGVGDVIISGGTPSARIFGVERRVQGVRLGSLLQLPISGNTVLRDGSVLTGLNVSNTNHIMGFPAAPAHAYAQRVRVNQQPRGATYTVEPGNVASRLHAQGGGVAEWFEWEEDDPQDETVSFTWSSAAPNPNAYEVERHVLFEGDLIAPGITGADVGFGLRFFADLLGAPVPAADVSYSVAAGTLIENPADALRYVLQELTTPAQLVRESEWPEAELSGMKLAGVLNDAGVGFGEIVNRLAYESRHHLFPREAASGTEYSLIGPTLVDVGGRFDFEYGVAPSTLSDYNGWNEERRNAETYHTRYRMLYARRREFPSSDEGFALAFRVTPAENGLDPEIATAELSAFEVLLGAREHPGFASLFVHDEATARQLFAYIVWNHSILPQRSAPGVVGSRYVLEVREVPPHVAYAFELGDEIDVEDPDGTMRRAVLVHLAVADNGTRIMRLAETV